MKKLISIIVMVVLVIGGCIPTLAKEASETVSYINIRPKHEEAMPGDDSLYYGYIPLTENFKQNQLNYIANAPKEVENVRIEVGIGGRVKREEHDLKVGENKIEIDAGGKIYIITIIRARNFAEEGVLKWAKAICHTGIQETNIELTPQFNPDILHYTATVENTFDEVSLMAGDGEDLFINNSYDLVVGNNSIDIKVKSLQGQEKMYKFDIYRKKSCFNQFAYLQIEQYDKENNKIDEKELYDVSALDKTMEVGYDTVGISLIVWLDQTIDVKGEEFYNLKVGLNKINFITIAENGEEKNYQLKINRKAPSAKLDMIQINEYCCGAYEKGCTLDVNYSTASVDITAIPEDQTAKITGTGTYNLKVGKNKFMLKVIAADGKVKKYPITINRLKQEKFKIYVIVPNN